MTDYYNVIGCNIGDSSRKIYKLFKKKVFPLHPDNDNNKQTDKKKFIELCKAYFVIGDMDQRAPYDLIYKNHFENKEIEYSDKEKQVLLEKWDSIGGKYANEYYNMSFNEFRRTIPKSMNLFDRFIYILWAFINAI